MEKQMEIAETTTLKIMVLSPFGIPRYKIVLPDITMDIARSHLKLLETLHYDFECAFKSGNFLLIIKEPDLMAAEIIVYNSRYFEAFGISEFDKIEMVLPGDPMFWDSFNETEIVYVNHLLSNFKSSELEKIYNCEESTITRRSKEILSIVKIKYPKENLINRNQFKKFAIRIGVYVEVRCSECNQKR